jgi:glycosyltransferase involved in cell wall biosynthesis
MHIAFITVGDLRRLTGGYLYHARLFAGLRAQGVRVSEIVAAPADPAAQRAAAAAFGAGFDPAAYDVIVVDALARIVCGSWPANWQKQRPLLAMIHELPSIATFGAQSAADESTLLQADRLITVSGHGRAILLERGVPAERIAIVSPGFDRIAPPPEVPAKDPTAPLHALCVAQWIPRKNITTLLRAWRQRRHRPSRLELVGETDADPTYAAKVRTLHAAQPGDVRIHGACSDEELAVAYARADLFVLPTRYEGYGMVFAEALAHGLPVIAGNAGPVPAIVGEAGLLVPPDDIGALAAALDQLLLDQALRARMAAAARRQIARLPAWDDTVHRFLGILQRSLRSFS